MMEGRNHIKASTTRDPRGFGMDADSGYHHQGSVGGHQRMKTIDEQREDYYQADHETRGGASMMSRSHPGIENDMNAVNRSNTMLEESMAEPGRPPQHIAGLTDFLTEEYFKKYGIYTTEAAALQGFWRDNVSAVYKELRLEKKKEKEEQTRRKTASYGEGFGGYSDFGVMPSPGPNETTFGKAKAGAANIGAKSVKAIPRPELPKDNFMKRYARFSKLYELDVCKTVDDDVKEMRDQKRTETLAAETAAQTRAANEQKKTQTKKMQAMFDAYYERKYQQLVKEQFKKEEAEKYKGKTAAEIKKMKEEEKKREQAEAEKAAKEERAKTKALQLSQQKRAQSARPMRPSSAAAAQPNARGGGAKDVEPTRTLAQENAGVDLSKRTKPLDEKIDRAELAKINKKISSEKSAIEAVMYLVYDIKVSRMAAFDAKRSSKSESRMTNDPEEIIRIYQENKTRCRQPIPGGETEAARIINDFFSNQNTVLRLVLYKDVINKSKRKGAVPLQQFYINMLIEEKLIYMVYKPSKPMMELVDKPKYDDKGNRVPNKIPLDQYMIYQYEEAEKYKAEEKRQKKEEREWEKKVEAKRETLKAVFGDSYKANEDDKDPNRALENYLIQNYRGEFSQEDLNLIAQKIASSGIILKPRDVTAPKDKWKVGNALKALQKKFPHDRVLERMIAEEFKTNQLFKYPEEYDLYDATQEEAFKKGFKNKALPGEQPERAWKLSADQGYLEKQQEQLENFKKADMYDKKGYEQMLKEQAKKELALEKFLHQQAFDYQDYVEKRNKGAAKKTLRTVLAENYQAMLKEHGKLANERFPHTAYGQNKESETFKKSYPISYKNYFFKLVKNIIKAKTGKRTIRRNPVSLVSTAGARESTKHEPLVAASKNARLRQFTLGKLSSKFNLQPDAARSRAFRRPDMQKRLRGIFMQFSEIENCTFEPEAGSLNPASLKYDKKRGIAEKEYVAGEFFTKMGTDLIKSNPTIYKKGILKRAQRLMRAGDSEQSLSVLLDGFNIAKVLQHFNNAEYTAWQNHKSMLDKGAFKAVPKLADLVEQKYHAKVARSGWFFKMLDQWVERAEQVVKDHKEKQAVYAEDFMSATLQPLYEEVWELLREHIKEQHEAHKAEQRKAAQQTKLKQTLAALKEQLADPGAVPGDDAHDGDNKNLNPDEIDQRKIYKTIMCPLKADCPKVKMQRWPFSGISSKEKFGKDCPYAHHPMELQFKETLAMRAAGNKAMNTKAGGGLSKGNFKHAGDLYDCRGCGAHCNMCRYKQANSQVLKPSKKMSEAKLEKIEDRKKINDENCNLFAKKFGLLKKANVLMFYGRSNDAFDEIAKAAEIIKKQWEASKTTEEALQKRWQATLGLQEGLELPKPIEKIKEEDLDDEFFKSIDANGADVATLKLYIQKVCPNIRNAYDKNIFLNGLIEDLYQRAEDAMIEKQENIKKIQKNVERLGEINELYEVLGSDADKDPEACIDAEGNPIKMKKRKHKMCENIYQKRYYKEDGIEMKTKDKHYIDTVIDKKEKLDLKTMTITCQVCPKGKECPHAHNAIELDLISLNQNIKNLNGIIKSQTAKLKNAKPLEPWRPSAKNFTPGDIEEPVRNKKKSNEDEEKEEKRQAAKRKGILERENVFRKPYEKE